VAGDADKSFELWGEICGTRSTKSKRAIATAKDIASPDIITLTDCLATLSRAERLSELDEVFEEAVSRGIILRSNELDEEGETDLSGMSLPVARAAVRYILRQCVKDRKVQTTTFITGIGVAQQRKSEEDDGKGSHSKDPTSSLRDYVQEVLQKDFEPSIESTIPMRAQGTVEISQVALERWIKEQKPLKKK